MVQLSQAYCGIAVTHQTSYHGLMVFASKCSVNHKLVKFQLLTALIDETYETKFGARNTLNKIIANPISFNQLNGDNLIKSWTDY